MQGKSVPPPPTGAPPPPLELTRGDLHSYQVASVRHVTQQPNSMLWLDLGLGKTVVTLTAFSELKTLGLAHKMLVVAPLRVCELQWEQEIQKWSHLKGKLKFAKMLGSLKKRQTALFSTADVYLVNYESLSWLTDQLTHYFIKQKLPLPFDVLVLDEVSKLKRPESDRFAKFSPICAHFNRKIGLTASPSSNGLHNLWGQFFCIDQGVRLGLKYTTFKTRFFDQIGDQYPKYVPHTADDKSSMDTRAMIVSKISDITIEIPAKGNIDMPELSTLDITVTMPPGKYKQYLALEKDFFVELDNGTSIELFNQAALSNKLLQMANGIMYNYPDELNPEYRVEEKIHDKKYDALADIINESGDEPILLAYNFTSEKNEILRRYPNARCLTGVKEEEAIEIQTLFNSGAIKLLIAHPASAAFGINLQGACSIVVWFGLNYNLEYYLQFVGRVYRQGQKKSVRVFRILTKDTMDQAVQMALSLKNEAQEGLKEAMRAYRSKKQ